MNTITKNRVRLIRAIEQTMIQRLEEGGWIWGGCSTRSCTPRKPCICCWNKLAELYRGQGKKIYDGFRYDKDRYPSFSTSDTVTDTITYASKTEHKLDPVRRVETSLGRYIRRVLLVGSASMSDNILAHFVRNVASYLEDPSAKIEVLSGAEVLRAYENNIGTSSCMTGDSSVFTSLYAMNPNKVQLVVYDKNKARALLWNTGKAKVMDRIYPNDGLHVNVLHRWARQQGYVYRINNSAPSGSVMLSDGKVHKISLRHGYVFPYMDTFAYGDMKRNGTITVTNDVDFGTIKMMNTNGKYVQYNRCFNCKKRISQGNTHTAENHGYCIDCLNLLFSSCHSCGAYHSKDGMLWFFKHSRYTSSTSSRMYYCRNCTPHLTVCACCGEGYVYTDYGLFSEDGMFVCYRCLSGKAKKCLECGYKFLVHSDSSEYCVECYSKQDSRDKNALLVELAVAKKAIEIGLPISR